RPNGTRRMVRLREGAVHTEGSVPVKHADILAAGVGAVLTSGRTRPDGKRQKATVRVLRPAFTDFCTINARKTTPSFPKDCAAVSLLLDVQPGQVVLEAGTGAGGMTTWLSRAVGPSGRVFTVDNRPAAQEAARAEIERFFSPASTPEAASPTANVTFLPGDLSQWPGEENGGQDEENMPPPALPDDLQVDGVVLDMLRPWTCLKAAATVLKPDGNCVVFCSNIAQVMQVYNAVRVGSIPLWLERTIEVHHREWLIAPPVARPKSMETPHTGFLMHLKRVARVVAEGGEDVASEEAADLEDGASPVEGESGAEELTAITDVGQKRFNKPAVKVFDVSVCGTLSSAQRPSRCTFTPSLLSVQTTHLKKNRKKRSHVSAGHGRIGKHRKHPSGRGNAGGQHHHRILFDKFHPGYFGKVGMRYFHKTNQQYFCPTVNVDKLLNLVDASVISAAKADASKALVIDVTQHGFYKVLGTGTLPNLPLLVKARFVSAKAEQKIKAAGGAVELIA
ncbi:RPL27AC, partial [Symbiodinium sp. KB8]